ncbi:glycine betaine/L-proline ABC transporter ATP-binding protein ProV [Celerinatantimonas sp. YJH-8]|uniref:glycine betaine/L-proline ABC transporter ATP-binding protein ProV n=1 Tax=Celerinatantimonas sp. YJH-8 TaxID=3228714 RepID=UPI0038C0C5BE
MTVKLEVKNLFKIFGDDPDRAFSLIEQGKSKDEIFNETGLTVGVKDASLSINEGEIFVIMGLSGSGKSTLVRLLNRLIPPTRGHVFLNNQDISAISDKELREVRRKSISMVFQSFALMPHMNIIDNTAFGLELAGVDVGSRHAVARKALARVGLEPYCESYPDELSGGMKQRVGLARALANDPEILLMDEAFSALDPLIRTEMQDELIRLQNDDQRTIVFISHDLDEAMRIGDRIAIMQGGEVVQVGTPDDILHNPANDYVKSFFKGVDVTHVFSAKDIARSNVPTVIRKSAAEGARAALQLIDDSDWDFGIVLDRRRQYLGMVTLDSLQTANRQRESLVSAIDDDIKILHPETALSELISDVASVPYAVPVVDDDGRYLGVITKSRLLKALDKEIDHTHE